MARRRKGLAEGTRRSYQCRLDRNLNAIVVLAPVNPHGRRLRKRYGEVRSHLFTFLEHPETPARRQWRRARAATHRDIPQGHRRIPIARGRRPVRRHPIRPRNRSATWHRRLSGNSRNSARRISAPDGGSVGINRFACDTKFRRGRLGAPAWPLGTLLHRPAKGVACRSILGT
jgi:hypothetical protein